MRIRQIKPEFWNDATMVDLPLDTRPPAWKPKDVKYLNSDDTQLRENARKAAETAGIDWRELLEAKGEEPHP